MTKIKICGIRRLEDALAAAEAGADMLGFNFHLDSVRYIDAESCARISSVLRQQHPAVQLVGVFVNASAEQIRQTLGACMLDMAQLSGDETPALCAELGGRAFKAFHGVPQHGAEEYARRSAPAFLVDGHASGAYGGTGVKADWEAARELASNYAVLLAGGLTPDNVAEAIRQVKPWGVDVASGVESRPGEKDAGRMRAFIQAVRSLEMETI